MIAQDIYMLTRTFLSLTGIQNRINVSSLLGKPGDCQRNGNLRKLSSPWSLMNALENSGLPSTERSIKRVLKPNFPVDAHMRYAITTWISRRYQSSMVALRRNASVPPVILNGNKFFGEAALETAFATGSKFLDEQSLRRIRPSHCHRVSQLRGHFRCGLLPSELTQKHWQHGTCQ